jgi:hypothetical protein
MPTPESTLVTRSHPRTEGLAQISSNSHPEKYPGNRSRQRTESVQRSWGLPAVCCDGRLVGFVA